MPQAALVGGPDVEALGGLAHCASPLGVVDSRGDGDGHCVCDLVLHRKNIREIAVVVVGPDVLVALSLDRLCSNAYPIACLPHAAFERIAHPEIASDLLHV